MVVSEPICGLIFIIMSIALVAWSAVFLPSSHMNPFNDEEWTVRDTGKIILLLILLVAWILFLGGSQFGGLVI